MRKYINKEMPLRLGSSDKGMGGVGLGEVPSSNLGGDKKKDKPYLSKIIY